MIVFRGFDHTGYPSSELIMCLNFIYTFRLKCAEDTKEEEEVEELETDANMEEENESAHSLSEVIDFFFSSNYRVTSNSADKY